MSTQQLEQRTPGSASGFCHVSRRSPAVYVRIGVIVDGATTAGRKLLSGIGSYLPERPDWAITHVPTMKSLAAEALRQMHGVIIADNTPNRTSAWRRLVIPAVEVSTGSDSINRPSVNIGDNEIGQMAARHLLERGLRSFAVIGRSDRPSRVRCDAFCRVLRTAGHEPAMLRWPKDRMHRGLTAGHIGPLGAWIARLPKPVGLFAARDEDASRVLMEAVAAGFGVPSEVAVIGGDNDETICNLCLPALTSVEPNHTGAGYEAARLLAALLDGAKSPDRPIVVAPQGIIERKSTHFSHITDAEVTKARQFIRARIAENLSVEDVAAHVGLSRSTLLRRFRAAGGRSVHDEILATRLEEAKRLLADTEQSLLAVAHRVGLRHQEYLGYLFRQHLGTTPAAFRAQSRLLR